MRKSHAEMPWEDREAPESRQEKKIRNPDSKRIRTCLKTSQVTQR